jgi:hypothetical protein
LERALCETAAHPHPETLETFRRHLDPAWIDQALELTGTMTLRKRRLPAEQVVWLVLGMALMRDRPIQVLPRQLVDGDASRLDDGHRPVVGVTRFAMGITRFTVSQRVMATATEPGGLLS